MGWGESFFCCQCISFLFLPQNFIPILCIFMLKDAIITDSNGKYLYKMKPLIFFLISIDHKSPRVSPFFFWFELPLHSMVAHNNKHKSTILVSNLVYTKSRVALEMHLLVKWLLIFFSPSIHCPRINTSYSRNKKGSVELTTKRSVDCGFE